MDPISARHELRSVGVRNHTGLDDRTLPKLAARGVLKQVRRGVFVPVAVWQALDLDERRRLTAVAAAERSSRPMVFSHRTAAVLQGVPFTGRHDRDVDVLTSKSAGSRREHGFVKHATGADEFEIVEEEGLLLTSIARTVVELAMTLPFRDALAAADWALKRGLSRDRLLEVLHVLASGSSFKRGLRVILFADARSGSPDESKSRALIEELGFPRPDLQTRFDDAFGLIGFVDFFWSEAALIGEFDGAIKLEDPVILAGRTPLEAVKDEKRREDRLRATGPRVVRWVHEDLTTQRLGTILFSVGLRRSL